MLRKDPLVIIVEGPDGSGKTTLIQTLTTHLQLPLHERACTSDGVPNVDGGAAVPRSVLFDWAYNDVTTMREQPMSIYDRHPMISEYVYGPIIRGELPEGFESHMARNLVHHMASECMVVMCRPPLRSLISSVSTETQMPGVVERIGAIRAAYDLLRVYWPRPIMTYDWNHPEQLDSILARARNHTANQQARRGNR